MIFRPSLTKSSLLLNKTKYCKIPCTDIFFTASQCSLFRILANNIFKITFNFSYFHWFLSNVYLMKFSLLLLVEDLILISQWEDFVGECQPIRSQLTSAGCWLTINPQFAMRRGPEPNKRMYTVLTSSMVSPTQNGGYRDRDTLSRYLFISHKIPRSGNSCAYKSNLFKSKQFYVNCAEVANFIILQELFRILCLVDKNVVNGDLFFVDLIPNNRRCGENQFRKITQNFIFFSLKYCFLYT